MGEFGGIQGLLRRHPVASDTALGALIYAGTLLTAGPFRVSTAASLAAALACGALMWRRRHPIAVLAVTTVGTAAFMASADAHGPAIAAPMVALYSAAEVTRRRMALSLGWLAVLVLAVVHAALRPPPWLGWENVALIALAGLAIAAGDAARSRRAYVAEVEDRARRAEHDREREARRRISEERLRIARDLHDVVGHHLALINVQAGVAAQFLQDRPDQARDALAEIRQATRAGLHELHHTIGLLREDGEPAAPTTPAAGLSGLNGLLESLARAGLTVDQDVTGTVRPLPPAADLTAYRVVQESLTNIRKHADGATARLRLAYESACLNIEVENDGNVVLSSVEDDAPEETAGSSSGHGIAGMRERVAAIGGRLEAGPRPGGGFRVAVRLPMEHGSAP
jgi:signal transduction histidine kinase